MHEYAEKRGFHRMGIECPARFRIQGTDKITEGTVKNLSASGLLLLTPEEIDPGSQLQVHIEPANSITPPLSASVNVLRTQPAPGGGYEVACAIVQILGEEETGAEYP